MKTSKRSIIISLMLIIVMLLGISMLTACGSSGVTPDKLQSEYGVVIEGGDFEKGSTLVSNEIVATTEEATEVLAVIADQNYDKDGSVYIFDIYVMKDGVKVQPNGKVKVSVPVPNVQVVNWLVFHVKADNSVENLVPTVADGKISFETSSFSYFVIAEAASAEHEHSFGNWTPDQDNQNKHYRECECGEKETATCTYDEGVVTEPATHLKDGIKTFTCTVCGATKEEPIAKISEHSFGNWTPDKVEEGKHYRECACGTTEMRNCTFGPDGVCVDCGREKPAESGIIIVIAGGTATFTGKETVKTNSNLYGENATVYVAQENDVLSVTLTEQEGRTFKHWASANGTIIPDATFSMLVNRNGYYYPVFEDSDGFSNPQKISEGNCEEGTLYMSTNSKGDIKYALEFVNGGCHNYTVYQSFNDKYHAKECVICGEMIFEEHTEKTSEVVKEPTHTEEGVMEYECSCGHTWTESIPTTEEHCVDYDKWDIVAESKDGQYGKYRVYCEHCEYYEEYWYLGCMDFLSFIDGKVINYQYIYGLDTLYNEYLYNYTNADGEEVYIWAFQYKVNSGSYDNNDTYIFMYIDDGNSATMEPVYLSKSGSRGSYLWANYGYAHDVNDWLELMNAPDRCIGSDNDVDLELIMNPRGSVFRRSYNYWAITYNGLRIPTSKECDDFSNTKWEIKSKGTSASNGREYIAYTRKGTTSETVFNVDKATGITLGREYYDSYSYNIVYNMMTCKTIVSPEEYSALDETVKAVSYSYGDIEQDIKSFCAKRNSFPEFTLTVPAEPSAFRLLVSDPTNSVTLGGSYINTMYNPAQVYNSGNYITLTWNDKDGIIFEGFEIWDFNSQSWVLLYKDQDLIINSTTNPRTDATYIRTVYHETGITVDPSITYTITVNDGYFEIGGDKYVGTVEVAKGTLVNVYAKDVAGKSLDYWLDGNGETFSEQSFYVTSDITLSPVYKETTYYFVCTGLTSDSSTPYVSVNGEEVTEDYISQCKYGDKFELSTSQAPESECNVFMGWNLMIIVGDEQQFELVSYSQTITYEITDKISMEQYGIKQIAVLALWVTEEEYVSAAVTPTYVDIRVENGFVNYSQTPSAPSDNAYSSISVSTMGFATFFDDPTDETVYTAWDVAYRYEIDGEVQHDMAWSYEDEYDYYPAQYWVNDPEYSYPDGVINVTGITESSGELE